MGGTQVGMSGYTNVQQIMLTLFGFIILVVAGSSIYALVVTVFQFIFSKGDTEKVKKAFNNLRYTIIGVFLSIFLIFGVPFLLEQFQIPGYKVYTFDNILQRAARNFNIVVDSLDVLSDDENSSSSQDSEGSSD